MFISYRSEEPDQALAHEIKHQLEVAGHQPFMAATSIQLGDNWSQRIDQALQNCDYFLLLLSKQAASSEMVTEEVRRAKELRDGRGGTKPRILPIRVQFPRQAPLNYDLRGYLNRIQQREWTSAADTPAIVAEVLDLLATGGHLEQGTEPTELVTENPAVGGRTERPMPVAEPELPGGLMRLASEYYIERNPIEARCYAEIQKPGALIRIKAPRQMGKTSLMARILHYADLQGCRTTSLTFQLTDESLFTDLEKFLKRFCALVSRKLQVSTDRLNAFWEDDLFGPMETCSAYFEECLLPALNGPLVLALDEVDRLFAYEALAKDFLGLLRVWNEQAKMGGVWSGLRLIVVHSTESYVVMDVNASPFNVGMEVKLPEFTADQVLTLAQRHGLAWSHQQVAALMAMLGGHPFLTRVALYHIAQQDLTLQQLLVEAPTEASIYDDHLRRHLWNLEQHPELLTAMKQTVANEKPVRLKSLPAFKLNGMGLINLEGNDVTLRYDLYRKYFRDRLRIGS